MGRIGRLLFFAVAGCFLATGLWAKEEITLKVAGRDYLVLLHRPEGFKEGDKLPLCVLLPPGSGPRKQAEYAYDLIGKEMQNRGWLVAAVVVKGTFIGGHSKNGAEVVGQLSRRDDVDSSQVLLAGISNGGMGALEVAGKLRMQVKGVMAVPGLVRNQDIARNLRGMPIYLRVGAKDELKWGDAYPATERALRKAKLDAKLLPKAAHSFRLNWQDVDAWLANNGLGKK